MKEALFEAPPPVERIVQHVARFFESQEAAQTAVDSIRREDPGVSKEKIFHIASNGKGKGKPHASGHVIHPRKEAKMRDS